MRLAAGVTANTINLEHVYLRALFNELAPLGFWTENNPLAKFRQFKITERELSYLADEEMRSLLAALESWKDQDALLITKLCLASAARWNEGGVAGHIPAPQRRDPFHANEDRQKRSIPIDDALADEISDFYKARIKDASGRIFKSSVGAFRMAVKEQGIERLPGQHTHVLRHAFASHVMMSGGNILELQKVRGHSSLQTTMIYATSALDTFRK